MINIINYYFAVSNFMPEILAYDRDGVKNIFSSHQAFFLTKLVLLSCILYSICYRGRHSGLMVSALDSGSSGSGSVQRLGHCVVFLGKTLYFHGASLHPGV